MAGILCAIRGGPDSRRTIDLAIQLAKEKQQTIYFLYIVNLDFLTHTSSSRVHAINEEMQEMGEFILLSAQERASRRKVASERLVRHGTVGEEIIAASRELNVDYVVIGKPTARTKTNAFDVERLTNFGRRIEEETGAQVIFAGEKSS